jgi:type III secretion protein L
MAIGKVIKGDGAPDGTNSGSERPGGDVRRRGGVVNAEVFEAHQEANAIVEAANRRAAEILEEAKRERSEVIAKAKEAGRQEGLKKVTEEFAKSHIQRGEMIARAESDMLKLALKIAEKIIGRDLERDPAIIANICATAIENVRNAQSMVLRVNPQDASVLRDRRKQLMEMIGRVKDISIKDDPDVAQFGCVIETDSGTIDAQLVTQLEMLLNVLVPDSARKEPR